MSANQSLIDRITELLAILCIAATVIILVHSSGVSPASGSLAEMKARGVAFVGEAPRPGAGGTRVAFVHPRSASGVLLELKEAPRRGANERTGES